MDQGRNLATVGRFPTPVGPNESQMLRRIIDLCRVAFIVLLADLETATHFDTSPLLPFSELVIDLPSSDSLWQAKTASAWLALRLAPSTPQSIPFLDAIRALLSPTKPEPYTTDGILLAELPRLPPFPLLILSRTLSFLQKKTEEAIAQVDPFRFALGGLGLYEDREKENLKVLERIQRGREILKTLPGGVKRGGGEKWYEGVCFPSTLPFSSVLIDPQSFNSR